MEPAPMVPDFERWGDDGGACPPGRADVQPRRVRQRPQLLPAWSRYHQLYEIHTGGWYPLQRTGHR
jgi:hypothetical protein